MPKPTVKRRVVIGSATALGVAAAGLSIAGVRSLADAEPSASAGCPPPLGPVTVTPDDPRYGHLVARGINPRFQAEPEYLVVAGSTEQIVTAVGEAVAADRRVVVRSGGHCFDNLVDNPETEVIIDTSAMTAVYFDPDMRAFAIEPGATLGEVYRRLHLGWGVTIPAGGCPEVGAGGHILGGGYGPLSRAHGLSVDHLYAVEVVTVDESGEAKATVATRDADDPNRELWWAHTGGGGGNFGIVTRYWMRSPDTDSKEPAELLPQPPTDVVTFAATWNWSDLDEASFSRLVAQHGQWHEDNSDADSPFSGLYSVFMLYGKAGEVVMLAGQVAGEDPQSLLDEYLAAVGDGLPVEPDVFRDEQPWLTAALDTSQPETDGITRDKLKNAYLRKRLSDEQIAVLWQYLSDNDDPTAIGALWLVSYGGQVNTVDSADTAVAQRDSILKAVYIHTWGDPEQDDAQLEWIRRLYGDVYAATGGVPAANDANDGCFINYADTDLADPELNSSGVEWHELFYGDNYSRLQAAKAAWDPQDIFRHALSIRPPN